MVQVMDKLKTHANNIITIDIITLYLYKYDCITGHSDVFQQHVPARYSTGGNICQVQHIYGAKEIE